jgi:deoxyribodipyrimidine photo-lyase
MHTAIWWIRRDLRLRDNHALCEALGTGARVVPLFIQDPALLNSHYHKDATRRIHFLNQGLRLLDDDLRKHGNRLIVRRGEPQREILEVLRQSGASAIFAEEDYTPYARRRDASVAAVAPLKLMPGAGVHHPKEVTKQDGNPYSIFTPFSRAWQRHPLSPDALFPAPEQIPPGPKLASLDLPPSPDIVAEFPPGESEAQERMKRFSGGPIHQYGSARDRMSLEGTSCLSPYLRFGMISARDAVFAAMRARDQAGSESDRRGANTWINEIIWRDFYQSVLYHFPDVLRRAFRPELRKFEWTGRRSHLLAWQSGRTGIPVVDAGMRQLAEIGWMHNRTRMITASFLAKNLLINWQEGELWFAQQLLDGDPAANNGGWQWSAGTGTDSAPYFRVFNPVLQGRRFDPAGDYVRRWIPELRAVPEKYIHEPWEMPPRVQQDSACKIGRDYPDPIVDLAESRTRALAAYRKAKPLRT